MKKIKHKFNKVSARAKESFAEFSALKGLPNKSKYVGDLAKSTASATWAVANKYPGRYFSFQMVSRGAIILMLGLPIVASLSVVATFAAIPAINQARIKLKQARAVRQLNRNGVFLKVIFENKKAERPLRAEMKLRDVSSSSKRPKIN